jgi:3-oxo-5alpha-steroid 4-dehydrogenase
VLLEADVVVVGFGAAGACAALEAAEAGLSVVIIDRFMGGGATALSGGVVYAGGGTRYQHAAGVADSVDAMEAYLRLEAGDVVRADTLRSFCEGSVSMLSWLEGHGVPFDGRLCPDKTSYPGNRHYLYFSGSEQALSLSPAPRGHRVLGRGTSGKVLFARLARAVRAAGVHVLTQTAAVRLVLDDEGRVVGVECRSVRGVMRPAHRMLHRLSVKPYLYAPSIGRVLHRPVARLEQRFGREVTVRASRGVVLAAGGFGANHSMLRSCAPVSRGGLPLATPGDDGSGISLGRSVGGAVSLLDRVSVWRFLTPPSAFVRGVLVDSRGQRIVDESRYGAAIGDAVLRADGRRAWLLVDAATVGLAWRQVLGRDMLWFQRLQALYLLVTRVRGQSVASVATSAGVDGRGLSATLASFNEAARSGGADAVGRRGTIPQDQPPYSLIDCSIRPRLFYPAPVLTLGGLVVDESTGAVVRPDGAAVPGLYAAGRVAVGLCSNSYVSGLSLADCVFSGRRAARSAAAMTPGPAAPPASQAPAPE